MVGRRAEMIVIAGTITALTAEIAGFMNMESMKTVKIGKDCNYTGTGSFFVKGDCSLYKGGIEYGYCRCLVHTGKMINGRNCKKNKNKY